nr:Endoglucanase E1 [Ipomoea batatas]
MTVVQSFRGLGLTEAISGLASRNPNLLRLNLVDAWKAVVEEIGRHGIMMVLDNHVSKPMWCCADHDGNGFFGSVYFDPDEWLQGLAIVANIFKDTPMSYDDCSQTDSLWSGGRHELAQRATWALTKRGCMVQVRREGCKDDQHRKPKPPGNHLGTELRSGFQIPKAEAIEAKDDIEEEGGLRGASLLVQRGAVEGVDGRAIEQSVSRHHKRNGGEGRVLG